MSPDCNLRVEGGAAPRLRLPLKYLGSKDGGEVGARAGGGACAAGRAGR